MSQDDIDASTQSAAPTSQDDAEMTPSIPSSTTAQSSHAMAISTTATAYAPAIGTEMQQGPLSTNASQPSCLPGTGVPLLGSPGHRDLAPTMPGQSSPPTHEQQGANSSGNKQSEPPAAYIGPYIPPLPANTSAGAAGGNTHTGNGLETGLQTGSTTGISMGEQGGDNCMSWDPLFSEVLEQHILQHLAGVEGGAQAKPIQRPSLTIRALQHWSTMSDLLATLAFQPSLRDPWAKLGLAICSNIAPSHQLIEQRWHFVESLLDGAKTCAEQ